MAEVNVRKCQEIEEVLLDPIYSVVKVAHLALLSATLLAICALLCQLRCHKVLLHGNLLVTRNGVQIPLCIPLWVLFGNIVLLHSLHTFAWLFCILRYQLLLLFYPKLPCALLTPTWMVLAIYAPYYMNSVAYPAFHFCVMLERWRATLLAEKYEREGRRLGIIMVLAIWCFSFGYFLYIGASALADGDILGTSPQGVIFLTSKYNASPIFCVTLATLGVTIFTAICDWRITLANRKIRQQISNSSMDYSLSRNYQLNENTMAMRLILPLDISYAFLYILYISIVLVIRAFKSQLPNARYAVYYNSVDTLIFLHAAITILFYIYFVRLGANQRQKILDTEKIAEEQAKIHFRQLEFYWH